MNRPEIEQEDFTCPKAGKTVQIIKRYQTLEGVGAQIDQSLPLQSCTQQMRRCGTWLGRPECAWSEKAPLRP